MTANLGFCRSQLRTQVSIVCRLPCFVSCFASDNQGMPPPQRELTCACLTGSIYGAASKSLFCTRAWQQIQKKCKLVQLKRELGCTLKGRCAPPAPRQVVTNFCCHISTGKQFSTATKTQVWNRCSSCLDIQICSQTLSNMCVYPPVCQVNPVVWSGSAMNKTISNASEKRSRLTHTHTHTHKHPKPATSCWDGMRHAGKDGKYNGIILNHLLFNPFFFLLARPCWRRRWHWRGLISRCWHPCDTQPSGGRKTH